MTLNDVGHVIASRVFRAVHENESIEIQVIIGQPTKFPDSQDFYTPYQIVGVGTERVGYAAGIDSVQSLQLVMKMISYDLQFINEKSVITLLWEGDENGDLGFPIQP